MGLIDPIWPKRPYLLDSFEEGWAGIQVVEMDTGKIQIFQTEKFFHVHVANTFENETGIVMDLGTFQDIPFSPHLLVTANFLNKTERDRPQGTMTERLHLHLAGPMKGRSLENPWACTAA